jgi:hypothetical protein
MSIVLHDIGRINIQPAMAASLEFIQVLESREDHLLAGLLDLTRKEDFIEDGVDLVEIKHQIQLAYIPEETVQDFDEKMNGFQICELIVISVDTDAEE